MSAAGPAAPIAYVLLYAVGAVAFVPGVPLSVAGGALFGPLWGTVLIVVGATLGAGGAFLVAAATALPATVRDRPTPRARAQITGGSV